jgi:hypothetical protein
MLRKILWLSLFSQSAVHPDIIKFFKVVPCILILSSFSQSCRASWYYQVFSQSCHASWYYQVFHSRAVHPDIIKFFSQSCRPSWYYQVFFTVVPCILILSSFFAQSCRASWYYQVFSQSCRASWYYQVFFHSRAVHPDIIKFLYLPNWRHN